MSGSEHEPIKVVVTGATGNVGTAVVRALAADPSVGEIVGLARRLPADGDAAPGAEPPLTDLPGVRFASADVVSDPLPPHFDGAGAVVHLAWAIQPSRDRGLTRSVNVEGSRRVFEAAAEAGVPALVHASSIGTYSPGPQDPAAPVDESWPNAGIPTSFYSADKAAAEAILDEIEAATPAMRVARLRPALIFKRSAGSEIRRLFAGPLVPNPLLAPGRLGVMPWVSGLRAQAVHSADVADAYRLAVLRDEARGAFNIAADPVLDADSLAAGLGVRVVTAPARVLRPLAWASWRAHLQPTPPGWLDMAVAVPLIDSARATELLGWTPEHSSIEALRELLAGIAGREGESTPPLEPDAYGPARLRELLRGGPDRA